MVSEELKRLNKYSMLLNTVDGDHSVLSSEERGDLKSLLKTWIGEQGWDDVLEANEVSSLVGCLQLN